jgi:hypothetical protein
VKPFSLADTHIRRSRLYCILVILFLLVSCTSTDKPPIKTQQDQNAQQALKSKAPLLLNDKMQYHMDVMNTIKAL